MLVISSLRRASRRALPRRRCKFEIPHRPDISTLFKNLVKEPRDLCDLSGSGVQSARQRCETRPAMLQRGYVMRVRNIAATSARPRLSRERNLAGIITRGIAPAVRQYVLHVLPFPRSFSPPPNPPSSLSLSLSLSLSHSFSLFSLLFPVCRHCVKHAQRGISYINFSDDGLHTCRAYARARALRERGDANGEGGGGGGGGGLVKAALDFSIEGTRGCTRDFSPRVLVS